MAGDRTEGEDFVIRQQMTGEEAIEVILQRLPGFRAHLDGEIARPAGDPVLLHVAMGDLGRYYMAEAGEDEELRRRYWATVEELAASPGGYVAEAVHTSLIEWFAWGESEEKEALVDAYDLLGPVTRAMLVTMPRICRSSSSGCGNRRFGREAGTSAFR